MTYTLELEHAEMGLLQAVVVSTMLRVGDLHETDPPEASRQAIADTVDGLRAIKTKLYRAVQDEDARIAASLVR